ncbi:MAG TPA: DUF1272 domain-containing protein [Polyangiaceae bacterium]|nr:DUF1272 domain-containing protein [Polyangiaceae bacterium]
MLELRPVCENCACALPPESRDAFICSFECTFCSACVERLENVCPNCGGGFCPRPVRPKTNWKNDDYLGKYPATTVVRHRPVDFAAHVAFARRFDAIPPDRR